MSSGGGIGPTIARLQQAYRARATAGQPRTAGALTLTEYSVAPVDAAATEGEVTASGLYIVKAQATCAALAGTSVTIDLYGAGIGSDRVDYRTTYIDADVTGLIVFATGTARFEEGATARSLISGATVTAHSLTYTLIEAS